MSAPTNPPRGPRSRARRSFLKAVGMGATALPFYRLLEDSFAHAAGDPLPLKLITISAPHGIAAEYWNTYEQSEVLHIPFRPLRLLVALTGAALAVLSVRRAFRSGRGA